MHIILDECGFIKSKREAHHKFGLGETPRHFLIRKRCRYSSFDKFEDAFNTALDSMQKKSKRSTTNGKMRATQQFVEALVFLVLWLVLQREWRHPLQTVTFVDMGENRLSEKPTA